MKRPKSPPILNYVIINLTKPFNNVVLMYILNLYLLKITIPEIEVSNKRLYLQLNIFELIISMVIIMVVKL